MNKNIYPLILVGAAIAVGVVVGYKVATDTELQGRVTSNINDLLNSSKSKVSGMSEDIAMKTAKITKNPKVNQEWVENQWSALGY